MDDSQGEGFGGLNPDGNRAAHPRNSAVIVYLAVEYQQPNHENNYVRTVGRDTLARLRFPVCLAASHVQKTRAHSPQVRLRHSHRSEEHTSELQSRFDL